MITQKKQCFSIIAIDGNRNVFFLEFLNYDNLKSICFSQSVFLKDCKRLIIVLDSKLCMPPDLFRFGAKCILHFISVHVYLLVILAQLMICLYFSHDNSKENNVFQSLPSMAIEMCSFSNFSIMTI